MKTFFPHKLKYQLLFIAIALCIPLFPKLNRLPPVRHYLYVAVPGVRNYLQYGGHGLLVFDMDNGFKFIKRIPTGGLDSTGKPSNVKGIAVSLYTHCIYISTIQSLICLDLITEKPVWEKSYEGGCDRMSISPDGKTIYLPSFEGDDWKVLDASTGKVINRVVTHSGSHNTVYGMDGKKVYLEGLRSNYLTVVNTDSQRIASTVGPFANHIRPFTIDSRQSRCFVNVDSLLGFETGDLRTGKKTAHIEVKGFHAGPVKRHGCPSHGIALNPTEKELWLADAFNERIHIFDISKQEPGQTGSIKLSDQPGWITFSMDGKYAMPSTGDIIDAEKKEIIARLKDETGTYVQSEKMVEVQFAGMNLLKAGDQFGIGRAISLAQVQVSKEPMHHNVFENAWVRVLDVHIPAGDTSLFHTHSTPSVFLVLSDTKTGSEVIMEPEKIPRLNDGHVWFEGFYDKPRVHRVWNSDTTEFHVIDMEILNKKYQAVDPPLNIPSLTLLFDENPVRGYRLKLDPQATLRISRRRAPIVLVKLTDAAGTVQANNKSFIKRGDYTFIQSGSDISFINTSNASQDLGLFELK